MSHLSIAHFGQMVAYKLIPSTTHVDKKCVAVNLTPNYTLLNLTTWLPIGLVLKRVSHKIREGGAYFVPDTISPGGVARCQCGIRKRNEADTVYNVVNRTRRRQLLTSGLRGRLRDTAVVNSLR